MAVETRVRLDAEPAPDLSIEGTWPGSSVSWTPDRRGTSALVEAPWTSCRVGSARPVHAKSPRRFLGVLHRGRQEDRARLQRRGQRGAGLRPAPRWPATPGARGRRRRGLALKAHRLGAGRQGQRVRCLHVFPRRFGSLPRRGSSRVGTVRRSAATSTSSCSPARRRSPRRSPCRATRYGRKATRAPPGISCGSPTTRSFPS